MKLFVIIFSFLAGIFISCKDDDDGSQPPQQELHYDERIVGSWGLVHVAGQPGPTGSFGTGTETLHYENGEDITIEFKTDNTFLLTNQSRQPTYYLQGFFNSTNDTTYIAPSKNKLLEEDEFLNIVEVDDNILIMEHIGYNKNGQSGWAFISRLRLTKN